MIRMIGGVADLRFDTEEPRRIADLGLAAPVEVDGINDMERRPWGGRIGDRLMRFVERRAGRRAGNVLVIGRIGMGGPGSSRQEAQNKGDVLRPREDGPQIAVH